MDLRVGTNDGVRSGVSIIICSRQVMRAFGVSKYLSQAAGLLVQALKGVVDIALVIKGSLVIAMSAAASTDASNMLLVRSDIGIGVSVVATKGCHTVTSSEREGAFSVEGAVIGTSSEDRRTLAKADQVGRAAGQVAFVVDSLFLAVARKNLMVVDEIGSVLVALDLVGNHLVDLTRSVDRDHQGTRGGVRRRGVGGIDYVGEDSIMPLQDHGGKGVTCSLQEAQREDDEEGESLVGAILSALKTDWTV